MSLETNYRMGEAQGAVLSDSDLQTALQTDWLEVSPLGEGAIQPASIDLRLGTHFRILRGDYDPDFAIDARPGMRAELEWQSVRRDGAGSSFTLSPGEFVLAETVEHVRIPVDLVGRLDGKSSLGRIGLIVHATAGFFDPGFEGVPTLEMVNVNRLPIRVYPGQYICQLSMMLMTSRVRRPYGHVDRDSRYQHQGGVTAAR